MKAYEISTTYDDGYNWTLIVWANSAGKAKAQGVNNELIGMPESIIYVRALRRPFLDDKEGISEKDEIILRLEHGYEYCPEDDFETCITKSDIPTIRKYSTMDKYYGDLLSGKIKTAEQIEIDNRIKGDK